MKTFLLFSVMLLPLAGCMTAAQKAQQNAQIAQLVASLMPEQKSELSKEILEQMTGLNQPSPAPYQPLPYMGPVYQPQTSTYCYPRDGYMYCNSY